MLCVVRMIARPGLAALINSHSTRREAGSRPWVCWEMEGGVGEDRGVKGGGEEEACRPVQRSDTPYLPANMLPHTFHHIYFRSA